MLCTLIRKKNVELFVELLLHAPMYITDPSNQRRLRELGNSNITQKLM